MLEQVEEVSVFYYVVYPDGRRLLVDRDSMQRNAVQWASEGLSFATLVSTQPVPVYGRVERLP